MPQGYNQSGDLLGQTADGTPLTVLWDEIQTAMEEANSLRDEVNDTFRRMTTRPADNVIDSQGNERLEFASEFGEPVGVRAAPTFKPRGAHFRWFDKAGRYTWQYLAEATADEVLDVANRLFEADSKTVHEAVLGRVFNNVAQPNLNAQGAPVYSLFNADGEVPPPFRGQTFLSTHQHHMTTGAATFTTATGAAQDLEALIEAVREHGHSVDDGGQIVVLASKAIVDVIKQIRLGEGTPAALDNYIPGAGAAAFLTAENLIGQRAPVQTDTGLPIEGSYQGAWIAQSHLVPAGYLVAVATYGARDNRNVVSFREHVNTSLHGFRLVKGRTPDYPLIDSFYSRGFGSGIRRRGGAAVMMVTSGAYTNPASLATFLNV